MAQMLENINKNLEYRLAGEANCLHHVIIKSGLHQVLKKKNEVKSDVRLT